MLRLREFAITFKIAKIVILERTMERMERTDERNDLSEKNERWVEK